MGVGGGGSGWGVRVDVIKELKFLKKIQKKYFEGQVGVGLVGGQGGYERNLGVGGDVGYGECEPTLEGIAQCTKRYCTILRKIKKNVGGGNICTQNTPYVFKKGKKVKIKNKK